MTVLITVGSALIAVLASAPQANAQALYACVKKNGSARIFTKKPKCKRGEIKLAWNIRGSAGKNGLNGINGTNGKEGAPGKEGRAGVNGAVAGYSASQGVPAELEEGGETTVLEKAIPAGHFLVSAKVETSAGGKKAALVETECSLYDGATLLDNDQWAAPLAEFSPGTFIAASNMSLQGVVNTTAPSRLEITCEVLLNKAEASFAASRAKIFAIQTSSNS